jgi:D-glycero-alpha-D-manno-heptose 1-phosphate guanylyltransferase
MIKEAIVLAGGLGTRLRSAVPDLPKCMAPVAGKPFLKYVMDYFQSQGIERMILALGYKHEVITQYVKNSFPGLEVDFSIEPEPLGTGGAIQKACEKGKDQHILVVNGDTLFRMNVAGLANDHLSYKAQCTVCLKPMEEFDRYGAVELDSDHSVMRFSEKKYYPKGLINGGVYALQREAFLQLEYPPVFSFEKDFLERFAGHRTIYGHTDDGYFIDIGIPEDYDRAQKELPLL